MPDEVRPVARLRRDGTARLAAAGVASPDHDAIRLLTAALGVGPGLLPLVTEVTDEQVTRFESMLARRERREPLQHILGVAVFAGLELSVGPGVFIPRPETEQMVSYVLEYLWAFGPQDAAVVDLCAGSGAIALMLQRGLPDARIVAVEADPMAQEWAETNARRLGLPVLVFGGDVTDPDAPVLRELAGQCDVVISNPPYVPLGTPVDRETAEHDPPGALWGGPDGLDVIRRMLPQVAAVAKPGALIAIEHDETQGESVPALLAAQTVDGAPAFTDISDFRDLARRPRFVTARRT